MFPIISTSTPMEKWPRVVAPTIDLTPTPTTILTDISLSLSKGVPGTIWRSIKNQNCFRRSRPFKISSIFRPKKWALTSTTPALRVQAKPSALQSRSIKKSRKILSPKSVQHAKKAAAGPQPKNPKLVSRSLVDPQSLAIIPNGFRPSNKASQKRHPHKPNLLNRRDRRAVKTRQCPQPQSF